MPLDTEKVAYSTALGRSCEGLSYFIALCFIEFLQVLGGGGLQDHRQQTDYNSLKVQMVICNV